MRTARHPCRMVLKAAEVRAGSRRHGVAGKEAHRDGVRLPFTLRVTPQWEQLRASAAFEDFLKRNRVAGI